MLHKKDKSAILFDKSTFKVAEEIFKHPNRTFHLRELAEKTGLSTTAVTRSIKNLLDYKIVKTEDTKLTKDINANIEGEEYANYKMVFNLYSLMRYGLVKLLEDRLSPEAVVLFGSSAKGEDTEEGDIDILVVSNKKSDIDITEYEKYFNRRINIHILKSLEKSLPEFKNAIANGIVLYGRLKLV